MFDAYCPTCAKRYLVFASQIRAIDHIDDDVVVSYECWCGASASWTIGRMSDDTGATSRHVPRELSLAG